MTSLRIALLAGALLSASPFLPAAALAQMQVQSSEDGARTLTLAQGKSAIIDLPRDAAEIFVANPKVANAVVRTKRRIFVMGVENGQTSIYALDKDGVRFLNLELRVGRDVGELRQILRTAMPTARVDVRTVNDTVILLGEVDSAADAQKAYDIATAFVGYTVAGGGGASTSGGGSSVSFANTQVVEGKLTNSIVIRGRDQVMVKVTVAEVRRNALKQFGVNPNGSWTQGSFNMPAEFTSPQSIITPYSGKALLDAGSGKLGGMLQMMERNGVARILSEPTVTATSGETAKFVAGGQTQVATSSEFDSEANACKVKYELKNYGVNLSMTPVVLTEGRIQLHVSTEVTEVDPVVAVTNSRCAGLPGVTTRANSTTLELPSGGSAMSAGLLQQHSQQIFRGQPGLMSLPILGALFRSREYQRQDTELVIIMTPYISKPVRADEIARPDDGFADPSDGQAIFLGRMNRLYSTRSNPQNLQILKGRVGFIND
jgi:pilus assembly protein CpaC